MKLSLLSADTGSELLFPAFISEPAGVVPQAELEKILGTSFWDCSKSIDWKRERCASSTETRNENSKLWKELIEETQNEIMVTWWCKWR